MVPYYRSQGSRATWRAPGFSKKKIFFFQLTHSLTLWLARRFADHNLRESKCAVTCQPASASRKKKVFFFENPKGDQGGPASPGSVTARIGFSLDSDLHEKSLRRIGSRWCKNHVESDLYVFVSVHFFVFHPEWICCPFKNTASDITWWDSHIKLDLCCM